MKGFVGWSRFSGGIEGDAERPGMHSHAEREERSAKKVYFRALLA